MPEGAPTSALGARSGAPSGLRPSSFVMCNTPVEVQFITSAGCLNYPCRTPVAKELKLDWDTIKTLEKQYMQAQLKRAGTPGPRAVGIDEISIRKGHSYRIVVSDLDRKRPIWFDGTDRSEASMAAFYDWLGRENSRKIKLADIRPLSDQRRDTYGASQRSPSLPARCALHR